MGLPVNASLVYTVAAFISLLTPFTEPTIVLQPNRNKVIIKRNTLIIYTPGTTLLTSSTIPFAVPAIVLQL